VWEEVQHLAARQARQLRKPLVITPHGMLTRWSLNQKWLKKRLYLALRLRRDLAGAAAIHFTTEHERQLSADLGLKVPAIVEPLGVDLSEFETLPERGMLRSRWPQLAGQRVILFLGRIHPGKGLEYLVPALARSGLTDTSLVVVGPDSNGYQATIEKLIEQHGLRGRVLFTGMLRGRQRVEALVDADLFALPSQHENFGIVVVEALACGTPVVISDEVAIHSDITAAGVGAAVPLEVPAVAAELKRWVDDADLRRRAAERARPFVWERYDWNNIARRWKDHYAALAAPAARC